MKTQQLLFEILAAAGVFATCAITSAQTPVCSVYRVVARHYDAELRKTWELRQDCLHPDWPAHAIAVTNAALLAGNSLSRPLTAVVNIQPLLVHAGESVRLWSQDASSRIEITGVAEQSAHLGERINVRLTRPTEDSGLSIQHIAGIVRETNSVEIAQ